MTTFTLRIDMTTLTLAIIIIGLVLSTASSFLWFYVLARFIAAYW